MYSKQVINPGLLSALAHGAGHVLSFAALGGCRDPGDRSGSLVVSPVPQRVSSTAWLVLSVEGYASARRGDDLAAGSGGAFVT